MGIEEVDKRKRNSKGDPVPRKVKRVIELDEPVFLAVQEIVTRLQVHQKIDINTFVQIALQRELRYRGVTWWETRVSKAMRLLSGSH